MAFSSAGRESAGIVQGNFFKKIIILYTNRVYFRFSVVCLWNKGSFQQNEIRSTSKPWLSVCRFSKTMLSKTLYIYFGEKIFVPMVSCQPHFPSWRQKWTNPSSNWRGCQVLHYWFNWFWVWRLSSNTVTNVLAMGRRGPTERPNRISKILAIILNYKRK